MAAIKFTCFDVGKKKKLIRVTVSKHAHWEDYDVKMVALKRSLFGSRK